MTQLEIDNVVLIFKDRKDGMGITGFIIEE